jgi:hypothetical protein
LELERDGIDRGLVGHASGPRDIGHIGLKGFRTAARWPGWVVMMAMTDHAASFPFHEKAPTILPDCAAGSAEPPQRRPLKFNGTLSAVATNEADYSVQLLRFVLARVAELV